MFPMIIAHRGNSSVAPENTMAAFESAARCGVQMIETDIHQCASGEIVVIHDIDIAATSNGFGLVSELTLPELRSYDFGSWFSPAYAGQVIPTLDDLIAFYFEHPGLELLLEFKGDWDEAASSSVIEMLETAGLRQRVILESFSVVTMEALAKVAPKYRRGLLVENPENEKLDINEVVSTARALSVMCLNPSVEIVKENPEIVTQCQENGLQVMVWTADLPSEFEMLTELGVDAICTNRPDYLAGWLNARIKDPAPIRQREHGSDHP